ncbi:hypothetical protein MMC30_006876 [Trapelia coarctata]|nr:hypothetical protein [Trapelia coarctata]
MPDGPSTAKKRLTRITDFLMLDKTTMSIPFDPNSTKFPSRKELPDIPGAPKGAAWVWGEDDYIGHLNLVTPTQVKAAAAAHSRTGEMVPSNLNLPEVPAFGREPFQHSIKTLVDRVAYDDLYSMNTQSGTQWDGFRHFAHIPTNTFYNNTHGEDITGPKANNKCSIHHWPEHGIAGRGIPLDYRGFANKSGITYDSYEAHRITYEQLYQCGKDQGIDIHPESEGGDVKIGDLLFIRSGFIEAYNNKPSDERARLATRPHQVGPDDGQRWAGVAQEEEALG